ncbi:hypothetical protein CEUSTIGMA_g3362.t1 [Chlamydomonas eustigma]|uniref:FAS1 domain-containing protein n=1 Tax=Chlamydomonas eustigma TaxID=1157962 RepID=A0A250WYZ5_9CHLO|nr:hypothetical protein CEUSTIGMA_g3362.t1 [Chlamydomonas eustigma]|eukprot:GAX75919.1 hypothetical protein CEUSTIGMA_g3362.t1 [Chlamydomonas eustigma]
MSSHYSSSKRTAVPLVVPLFIAASLLATSISAQQQQTSATIATVAEGLGLTILVSALHAAGGTLLLAATNSTSAVTVFAPTDVAFLQAINDLNTNSSALLANKPLLTSILSFHIVPGLVPSTAATREGATFPTLLSGQTLVFSKKGIFKKSYEVTGYKTTAKLLMKDVPAGGSLLHVIDRVLIPAP